MRVVYRLRRLFRPRTCASSTHALTGVRLWCGRPAAHTGPHRCSVTSVQWEDPGPAGIRRITHP